jgi:hypothetical protein
MAQAPAPGLQPGIAAPAQTNPATTPAVQQPPATASTPAQAVQTSPSTAAATSTAPTSTRNSATPAECANCKESADAYWVAFWVISGFLGLGLFGILISLRNSNWSIADALTEKSSDLTESYTITDPETSQPKQVVKPVLVGSASRLIATIGTMVITAILLGVGYSMIWSLFTRGQIPALEGIGPYLLGAGALFTPYAFNQLKEAFKSPPKPTQPDVVNRQIQRR